MRKARPKQLIDEAFDADGINYKEYELLQAMEKARIEAVREDAYPLKECRYGLKRQAGKSG